MVQYDYTVALEASRARFAELAKQRDAISIEMMQLEKNIQALVILSGQVHAHQGFRMDLNDAILLALRNSAQLMTPVGIRDLLVAMGVQFKGRFANPMSAIHNALKRLKKKGAVIEYEGGMWGVPVT